MLWVKAASSPCGPSRAPAAAAASLALRRMELGKSCILYYIRYIDQQLYSIREGFWI